MSVQLYRGDCLDILPTLDAGSVDAVVTDPPYGIGYQHSGGGRLRTDKSSSPMMTRQSKKPIANDNVPFDPMSWTRWPCVLWGAQHFAARLPENGSWLVWDKSCGVGPADSFVDADIGWCSIPGIKRNVCRYLWKGVITFKIDENNGARCHPMQKPIGLMRWSLSLLLHPGDTVLDPYMGSGTTGVAALRAGLNFIGIEIDPTYFAIAQRRIEAEQNRHPLFEPASEVQSLMFGPTVGD